MSVKIGIIGGSGLYDMAELTDREEKVLTTPFGDPSGPYVLATLRGKRVAFLARHGKGHRLNPSELNYRANIFGMKMLGVEWILSASAVGSLQEQYAPTDLLFPDQFIDRTFSREKSFFGKGLVAHVSMAHPVCSRLGDHLQQAATEAGVTAVRGGTYLAMEGPQFSSQAESMLYRQWGCEVIGMTNMPEAKLAREAELCYATVAMVTDYDCWHEGHGAVTVDDVVRVARSERANHTQVEVFSKVDAAVPRTVVVDDVRVAQVLEAVSIDVECSGVRQRQECCLPNRRNCCALHLMNCPGY